jgi:hypothetical protein
MPEVHHPRDTSFRGCIIPGAHYPRDTSSQRHIIPETYHPQGTSSHFSMGAKFRDATFMAPFLFLTQSLNQLIIPVISRLALLDSFKDFRKRAVVIAVRIFKP